MLIQIEGCNLEDLRNLIKTEVQSGVQKALETTNATTAHRNTNIYLNRKQTAKILGISLPTLSKWQTDGTIKSFRISSRIRFKEADIEDALKQIKSFKI
jgi:excisionase family DNA binding protein